tara:strand:+ start:973 stop:1149 length:177 start_codon:yes stop_codon:yes gene_type:complete
MKKELKQEFTDIFDKDSGIEANVMAMISLIWLLPIFTAYFIIRFAIINPMKSLFGVSK